MSALSAATRLGPVHVVVTDLDRSIVAPAPGDEVGLRRWTIVLPDDGEVARVRGRVQDAGLGQEELDGGFVVRDPWGIPLLVAAEAL